MSIIAIDCWHCDGEDQVCQASAHATQLFVTETTDPEEIERALRHSQRYSPEAIDTVLVGKGLLTRA